MPHHKRRTASHANIAHKRRTHEQDVIVVARDSSSNSGMNLDMGTGDDLDGEFERY